jgi:serine phosphatase RsbU (regulator of sigma subunit)/MFS family permease
MRDRLYNLAHHLYPALDELAEGERSMAAGYVIRSIIFLPLAIIGLAWLVSVTDLTVLRRQWLFLLILFAFIVVLSQMWLEMHFPTTSGGYRSERRSFWGEALWSGVLVIGPSANWLGVLLPVMSFLVRHWRTTPIQHLHLLSQSIFRFSILIPALVEVTVYQALGGVFPLPGLSLAHALPAAAATLAGFSLGSLMIWLSMGITRLMSPIAEAAPHDQLVRPRFRLLVILIGPLAGLVAILPAGLYSLAGIAAYFGFLLLMAAVAFLIDQLSRTAESARQRTRELEELETLSRTLLQIPLDDPALLPLLSNCMARMFPHSSVAVHIQPDQLLLHPAGWEGPDSAVWSWQPETAEPCIFLPGHLRPWDGEARRGGTILVPIAEARTGQPVGRVYLHREAHGSEIANLLPAVQSLSAQIASALHSVRTYRESLAERIARERATQELALAGQIQASFLPAEIPVSESWEIAAYLEPAYETSGDFYDIIPLWDGRLGLAIADVSDKGMGAALYMALCRTLLRAYAVDYSVRYPDTYAYHPERVITSVNQRIIEDTHGDFFVTLFYAIYDPRISSLTYTNAGHNPPYLFRPHDASFPQRLTRTGLPLGILDDRKWERGSVAIQPGDVLVMYTDGVTEAHDHWYHQFGEARLQEVIEASLERTPSQLCDAVRSQVSGFVGDAPRSDDVTMIVTKWTKPKMEE